MVRNPGNVNNQGRMRLVGQGDGFGGRRGVPKAAKMDCHVEQTRRLLAMTFMVTRHCERSADPSGTRAKSMPLSKAARTMDLADDVWGVILIGPAN
jgi:hypothetical protein